MSVTNLGSVAQRERTRREIEQRCDHLAALPEVVVKTLELLGETEIEPRAIEQQLRHDQVLVAKLLGLVNSPFYGLPRPIYNVPGAIMVIGFRGLRSLLLASGATNFLKRDYRCYGHDENGLLTHSVAVAATCRFLAQQTGQPAEVREDLFVAGLLHDIGKMLVGPYLEARADGPQPDESMLAVEARLVGLDHQEAGALIAAKWNLGPIVEGVLRHHHARDTPDELRTQLATVRLADALMHDSQVGYRDGEAPPADIRDEDRVTLGLEGEAWNTVRAELGAIVETAIAGLGDF